MTQILPIIKHWGIAVDNICLKSKKLIHIDFGISREL